MRIHHVNVIAPTGLVDDVASFWTDVFGLAPVERHGRSGRPGAWLQADGFQVHVSERDGAIHPDQHVAVVVDDYARVKSTAIEQGAEWEDAEPVVGSFRGFVRDPAGNKIEVMTDR